MQIKYLKHNEINFIKWDACISKAYNVLIYAESWYLNIVSPGWEALIMNDYEYVMPLPVKRKFGISFLVQPELTQQLGIFSANKITQDIIDCFVQKLPYRSYHLYLNEANTFGIATKPNYLLNLNESYPEILSNYSKSTKRNVKKAYTFDIVIKSNIPVDEFFHFFHSLDKNYHLSEMLINNLIQAACEREKAILYGAYNLKNELISVLCLLHSPRRFIYLLPGSNKEGKNTLAMFRIIDEIIQKHAMKDFMFDFAGSSVQSIAHFYQGFGAKVYTYPEIKHWSVIDLIERFY